MYPNPQDVLPLPPHPDLKQYRTRAKELVQAHRSATPTGVRTWAERWVHDLIELQPESDRPRHLRDSRRYADQLSGFAHERLVAATGALAQAHFVIARAHGFESWPAMVKHLEALAAAGGPASDFERAVELVIAGDQRRLERLLLENPALVHARSSRQHGATLLHYVAANGVENYRQRTPPNIVAITRLLLDAGADVNAEANIYGGGATALGLAMTSAHPRQAGVQIDLAELLLERGARLDADLVRSCLMNGCPEAAAYLERRGVPLGLAEAAGIGRLDLVERHFKGDLGLADPAWREEVGDALMMAIWYAHTDVVNFFLDQGFDPAWKIASQGESRTPLHLAAYEGRIEIVTLLIQRGAPVNAIDDQYRTPPLVWALHAWLVERRDNQEPYRAVVRLLVAAGATVKAEWIDDDRVRADPGLFGVLMSRVSRA